ncbi:YidH family protein [Brevirhabdus sp.]|uniref:YidH family protein n=1 Tax=Brevirhabdus sp. TaxID=2004514 RepID=UPI0040587CDC
MIDRFPEHAANERTFLAWIRTGVAIAGFGVLIERLPNTPSGGWTGLALVAMSATLVALSTLRFLTIRHQINRKRDDRKIYALVETLFATMLAVLLGVLFVFLLSLAQ